jgi:hypothetical protein
MNHQEHTGKTLIDVRRLAAIDMYGRHGSKRRRRLVLAEFVLAAIDIPLLGLTLVLAASSAPRVILGAYLIGVGLNFVPLALHAISISRTGRLGTELAGVDIAAELRRYTAKQLFIGIPLFVLILGVVQFAMSRRTPSESRTPAHARSRGGGTANVISARRPSLEDNRRPRRLLR